MAARESDDNCRMSLWSRLFTWLWPGRALAHAEPELQVEVATPGVLAPEAAPETELELADTNVVPAMQLTPQPQAELPPTSAPAAQPVTTPASIPSALPQRRMFAQHDRDESLTVILEGPEEEILWSIARRIETGRLDLPTLPSTSMAVIELANNPSVEFQQLVAQISMDPVLSSELLRTANSALYASEEPVDTLHSAIVRIGLRALRSMIFSVSMRGTILRSGVLAEYGEEVWRQSYSVATMAREIAAVVGIEPEKAFLLGLLQDIGKISLLAMLSKAVKDPRACTPNLVAHVFQVFHQEAGAAMARKWKLPAEFASVAGCHHEWANNKQHTRSAALANLSYRLDLAYSQQDAQLLAEVRVLPALLYLAPQENTQERILEIAKTLYGSAASGTFLYA